MSKELTRFLMFMRPAFSRRATPVWFVMVFVGLLVRNDTLGVSSIIRALSLTPESYNCLLHFFHSTAWSVEGLMALWWSRLLQRNVAYRLQGHLVLTGDHTQTPQDGRKMPAVATLHQDSETASKPSFFRGHPWGRIGILVRAGEKYFSTPLLASIQEGLEAFADSGDPHLPKTTSIVKMAQRVAMAMGGSAYLVLDAYFAVGPVFTTAAEQVNAAGDLVHILTRAKKNVVAYLSPPPRKEHPRGPSRKYGKKLRLMELFESRGDTFQTAEALVYDNSETIRYLTLNLIGKPIKGTWRFILFETARGRIILMTSDLTLDPIAALQLYCRRVTLETLFDTLKNTLGGMAYHFWSQYLSPASRRPRKKTLQRQSSSAPAKTQNTLAAIEKFVNVQLLVIGILQLPAKSYPEQIKAKAQCWLRTVTSNTPSEFVTQTAMAKTIKNNLYGLGKDWITQLIREKQIEHKNRGLHRKVA